MLVIFQVQGDSQVFRQMYSVICNLYFLAINENYQVVGAEVQLLKTAEISKITHSVICMSFRPDMFSVERTIARNELWL